MDRDRIEGAVKETEGKLTDDELREKQGQAQKSWGKAKDKADDAWEKAKDKADDAKDEADRRI